MFEWLTDSWEDLPPNEQTEILWLARKADSIQAFIKVMNASGIYLKRRRNHRD